MEFVYHLLFLLDEMSPYILLGFLLAGIMHAFIPKRFFARHLSGHGWKSVVKSALVGVPLPLCSCGVLPTAVAMRRNGASRAATTSFLVATPQTGVDSISATWAMMGPAFALVRPVAALITAVGGGIAVGKSEKVDTPEHQDACTVTVGEEEQQPQGFFRKTLEALRYGYIDLVGSIGGWLVVGLVIAALITVFVPADFFTFLGKTPIVAMLAVLVIAIPMYVCATGSIPIAMSLVMKGLSPGTALVLLMAGPAANFASFTLISREMGRKAAVIYLIAIIIGSVAFGLLIDYLLPARWFAIDSIADGCHEHHLFGGISTICSAILVVLLVYSFSKRILTKTHKTNINTDMSKVYIVKGMNCTHCQATVTKTINSIDGVTQADVNLSSGKAVVEGEHDSKALIDAVRAAGFDIDEA